MTDHDKSAAWKLFHKWYGWRVPQYATYTDYTINFYGLVLPPDKKQANALTLGMTYVTMHISDAASYAATGNALDLNDPTKAVEIYEIIMQHLADWHDHLIQPTLDQKQVPIVGLREFNYLANIMFPVAHRHGYFKDKEPTMSEVLSTMFGMARKEKHAVSFNDTIMRRIEKLYMEQGGGREQ